MCDILILKCILHAYKTINATLLFLKCRKGKSFKLLKQTEITKQ